MNLKSLGTTYLLNISGETAQQERRACGARPRGMSHANLLRVAKGGACPPLLNSYGTTLFLAWFLTMSVAWACNLPLDPKVFVLPESTQWDKTSWGQGIGGSKAGPMVALTIDEDQEITFKAYVDVTGRGMGLSERTVNINGTSYSLVSLPTLQAVSEAKMKFKELLTRGGTSGKSDPNALSLNGSIKDMSIKASGGGGNFGQPFNTTGLTDLKPKLPNPTHPNFVKSLGGGREARVTKGEYKEQGGFRFKLLSSTFEFDKTNIEGEDIVDGGTSGVANFKFNVPTSNKTGNSTPDYYYAGVGKVDLTLSFTSIVWTWTEQEFKASGTQMIPDGSPSDYEFDLSGEIVRTSEGSSTGGHPGYFYVKVRDTKPSIYSRMTGTVKGPDGTTGEALAPFNVTFDMVDNNPLKPSKPSIPVDIFYSLAVTKYIDGGYNTPGLNMNKLKFADYEDRIVWKKISGAATYDKSITYPGKQPSDPLTAQTVAGIGLCPEGPLTNNLSSWKLAFTVPDAMGSHYSLESREGAARKGKLLGWEPGRLKYFVVPREDGQGNAGIAYPGPAVDSSDAGAREALDPDYTETRADFSPVVFGTPPETVEATEPNEKIDKVVGAIGYWDVKDNDPPNLFLAIKDTRTKKTHIYGNNTTTMDSGTGPFTGYGDPANNDHLKGRADSVMSFEYGDGESADESGYGAFIGKYAAGDFFFHNSGENNDGLWIDEDSKLEFWTWGYDNINTYNNTHGLSDAGGGGNGGKPCWGDEGLSFSTFLVTDTPGSNSGRWFPEYIFRDPNRPATLNSGDCSVEVSTTDGRAGSRKIKVNIWAIWNKKEIKALEEQKYRK